MTTTTQTNWDRACPKCAARPGKPCRRPDGTKYTTCYGGPKFHVTRTRSRRQGAAS